MIDELEAAAARIVERTRAEQGKPRYAEDEVVTRVAAVLLERERSPRGMG